jgi:undecaprenyl-diphosphatase
MAEFLWNLDIWGLQILNYEYRHPKLDQFWLFITQMHKHPLVLIVLVPAILGGLYYIYRMQVWKILVVTGVAVGLADTLAYRVVKSLINRLRPFQNPQIMDWVQKVGEAHGQSFPSNHAANVFAAAAVLNWFWPGKGKILYILALIVGLSRVALGVHYPTDVLAGMILGLFVGFFIRLFILNPSTRFDLKKDISIEDENSFSWRTRTNRIQRR